MENILEIQESSRIDDQSGREIVQFTPILLPVCAIGKLSFSLWEAWADEPNTLKQII